MSPSDGENLPPMYSYSREEWFDICKKMKPSLDQEEFELLWQEFVELKRRKGLN
jgi:hypothetical protein